MLIQCSQLQFALLFVLFVQWWHVMISRCEHGDPQHWRYVHWHWRPVSSWCWVSAGFHLPGPVCTWHLRPLQWSCSLHGLPRRCVVCPSVCQLNVSVCLCLSICLSLSVCSPPCVCVCVHVCVHVCACLPVHLPASRCLPLPACMFVCLSLWGLHAHLSIRLHTPPLLVFPVWLSSLPEKCFLGGGPVCVSVCLSPCLCLAIPLSLLLSAHFSVSLSLSPSLSLLFVHVCRLVCPSTLLSACLPRSLWSMLSICASLSVCLSVCLTVEIMSVCPFSCQPFYLFEWVLDDICFTRHEDELIVDYLQWLISLLLQNTEYFIYPITGNHRNDQCYVWPLSGYYCINSTVTPVICPIGHYCPEGTTFDQEYPCPPGTFNNITGQFGQCLFVWRCSLSKLELFVFL